MLRKLKSRRGVTLSELLVAIALLSILSAMVVTGIGTSMRVYRASVSASRAQTALATLTSAVGDEVRLAQEVSTDAGGNVTYYVSGRSYQECTLSKDSDGQLTTGNALLVGDGVYSNKSLQVEDITLTYRAGVFHLALTVKGTDGVSVSCKTDFRWLNA